MKALILSVVFFLTTSVFAQSSKPVVKIFTQKDLNAYQLDQNTYDFIGKDSYMMRHSLDTSGYFLNPAKYKGILNYGVSFEASDKRIFLFIEDYRIFYTDVTFERCIFSVADSIVEIEGRISGGWNAMDFKGKPPRDVVEVGLGTLEKGKKTIYYPYNSKDLYQSKNSEYYTLVSYKGEPKQTTFPLDTLDAAFFSSIQFKKEFNASLPFKIRCKVTPTTVLSIGKVACFTHFFALGEMVFAQHKKQPKVSPRRPKDAPRFQSIIENNEQVNRAKPKEETPAYYQLTEQAENYIISRQYAKAKTAYTTLASTYPTLYARDIHNAIRVCILSRDLDSAFWWSEKLATKGVELPYFNSKLVSGLKKNARWKSFSARYDSIAKQAQLKWDIPLKNAMFSLCEEDQSDYGLENRKDSRVLYETTERVTLKLVDLLKQKGFPSEERIGVFVKKDTVLAQSPEFYVVFRHAVQQKPKSLDELNALLDTYYKDFAFDKKRSSTHRNFPGACFHIYKGNLYIDKSCAYNSDSMVRKMVFMFKNPHGFIIDNGNYIISEYNSEDPKEWDDYYENNFNFVQKLTDDWKFYEK